MPCSFILRTFCFFFSACSFFHRARANSAGERLLLDHRGGTLLTYQMTGNGDLWPSCWAEDDNLYAANGDGKGFGKVYTDMASVASAEHRES